MKLPPKPIFKIRKVRDNFSQIIYTLERGFIWSVNRHEDKEYGSYWILSGGPFTSTSTFDSVDEALTEVKQMMISYL